ncbi:hypothetical protein [Lyngbya aestuarii]|uniref:hypothetical protein n=1 Tax=Lyngbya aestuarii TaxID=118322 RepID=UPI00403D67D5
MIPTELSPQDQAVALVLEERGFSYTHLPEDDAEPNLSSMEEFQGWEIQDEPVLMVTHVRSGHAWKAVLEDGVPETVSQVKQIIHEAIANNFDLLE